ncbi:hypothetical protein RhiirA4_396705 [Rhizophagus irregularis]|uniref:Uncharacterized protein n=1 Tax=Rhizophagus irregularis TaxID=588596 RepID=A0A2I1G5S3_9GLOM|nr:hypothetical protein RhiirA4_396705 [Rhizophagus irregularis]
MFYKAKNGKIFQEELNTPIINKIIQVYVTNNQPYDLRNRSNQQQVLGLLIIKMHRLSFKKIIYDFFMRLKI